MGGIKKTGRKGRWSSGKWHRKEIKEWAGAKLWARKRDTGCPDKICVITESSLIVETVNSITKWCKSGKTRVSQQFHLKKKPRKKPPTTNQNNSGRYLQPIFGGAGKGKELPRSQILRLTTGLPSAIAVEFTLPAYLLPLQVPYLVLAFFCCLKELILLGCEQRISLLYVSCCKRSRYLVLTHLGDGQSCLPSRQETYW